MSHVVVGMRARKALYMVGAIVLALSIAVVSASKAEAEPALASYYGAGFAGETTASGEPFNPNALTAAHKTLPFGTQVEVCYQGCTVVTINDRGPYSGGRDYDLSRAAADAIGLTGVGVATIDATVLGQGGGTAEPAPEPAPEPAAAPVQEASAPQQVSDVQGSQVSQENVDVNVFEQSPGVFVSNVVVPVGPEGYQAAYERALELAQQRAKAAAGLI